MFVQLLLSLFGIVVVHRILSLFEKEEVFEVKKLRFAHVFLQIPLSLHLIFKELTAFSIIYIGCFLIILILSSKIIEIFRQNMFERMYLSLLQQLIVRISTGHSAKMSVKNVFNELSSAEKRVFAPFNIIFEVADSKFALKSPRERFFYAELAQILNSNSHLSEQLCGFRRLLSLQHNLRHRSRQSVIQSRAQAVVCGLIYIFLFFFSVQMLNFEWNSKVFLISAMMQVSGVYVVFKLGHKRVWTT